jgi:hypothetical protein
VSFSRLLILILLTSVSGCAAPGAAVRDIPSVAPANGLARITIERSTDFLYLALSARVKVNGRQVGELSRGDAVSVDIPSGSALVTVDTATAPGNFSMSLTTKPMQEYMMAISPRSESYGPGVMFGIIGLAVDASVNEQGGLFQVVGKTVKDWTLAPYPRPSSHASPPREIQTSTPRSAPLPAPPSAISKDLPEERLRKLKKLLDGGLISNKDYDQKKEEILRAM